MAEAERPAVGTEEQYDITEFETVRTRLFLGEYAMDLSVAVQKDIHFLYTLARTLVTQRDALIEEIHALKRAQEYQLAWQQRALLAESENVRIKARLREAERRKGIPCEP